MSFPLSSSPSRNQLASLFVRFVFLFLQLFFRFLFILNCRTVFHSTTLFYQTKLEKGLPLLSLFVFTFLSQSLLSLASQAVIRHSFFFHLHLLLFFSSVRYHLFLFSLFSLFLLFSLSHPILHLHRPIRRSSSAYHPNINISTRKTFSLYLFILLQHLHPPSR